MASGSALRCLARWAVGAVLLLASACVLPVRLAPGVEGAVMDASTGAALEGARVVVRFDGHHDDQLPDRDLLGFAEATTDANGRFVVGPLRSPGLAVWPLLRIETRLVAVFHPGHRCASPRMISQGETPIVALEPARSADEMRETCHPVPARRGEAQGYMAAWRALFPTPRPDDDSRQRDTDRVLAARSVFGFGENCEGPVLDMALAPSGRFAALVIAGALGPEIHAVELGVSGPLPPRRIGPAPRTPPRRIAWATAWELVLWEPASEQRRAISPSPFADGRFERIWHAPGANELLPAAPDPLGSLQQIAAPLDPGDLNDEADSRWFGRSFSLHQVPDPETGLAVDRLHIVGREGLHSDVALAGEACGPPGRFGRPHYRIAAGGRAGVDLRFVDGGCHAVSVDLETGFWSRMDRADAPATCSRTRRIPVSQLNLALRGYARELESGLAEAGADPAAPYALRIADDRGVVVEAMDFAGRPRRFEAAPFPVTTPLRRIEVSVVGSTHPAPRGAPIAVPGPEPL